MSDFRALVEEHTPVVLGYCDTGDIMLGCECGWREVDDPSWLQHLRLTPALAERDALLAVAEAARHAGATWDADQSGPWRPWEVYVDDFDALRSALTRLDAMLP